MNLLYFNIGYNRHSNIKQRLNENAVDVFQWIVKLVREFGGIVADKEANMEVPY